MSAKKLINLTATDSLNRPVFFISSGLILVFSLFTIFFNDFANNVIQLALGWVAATFGWYFLLIATVYGLFVILIACSRYGRIKPGPKHSKPEFSLFSWASMLFAAGIGIDLMFFSVAEPIIQYMQPPEGLGQTTEAARQAVVWTLFHYGLTGWCMYALMGMALGYFSYRYNLPLTIRSALYPIFGKKIDGPIGHAVDIAALLGAIFGIATTLGIGVMQLNYGLNVLFDFEMGLTVQLGLILLAVVMSMASALSGIHKGVRVLSLINVFLSLGLVSFLIIFGDKEFLLNAFVLNIGDYFSRFPSMALNSFAFDPQTKDWMSAWTLFFWAWWVAWAPFVGLFLARISRGRTIREFVVGSLTIPFFFTLIWLSVFGNSALYQVINGNEMLATEILNSPERGFYELLKQYPAFNLTASIATFTGLLFYVTSADSGSLVLGNFSSKLSHISKDAPNRLRVFWSIMIGLLTIAMLSANGITALQNATVTMGLPFSFVMILVMIGLHKSLKLEDYRQASQLLLTPPTAATYSQNDWKQRLQHINNLPDKNNTAKFLEQVCWPALTEVAVEFKAKNTDLRLQRVALKDTPELFKIEFLIKFTNEQNFIYQIWPQQFAAPPIGGIDTNQHLRYSSVEVFLLDGGQGNDIFGYSQEAVINDVLDQYERHLMFLHIAREAPGDSLIFPDPN